MWALIARLLLADGVEALGAKVLGGRIATGAGMEGALKNFLTKEAKNFISGEGPTSAGFTDAETKNTIDEVASKLPKPQEGKISYSLTSTTNYMQSLGAYHNWDAAMRSWGQYLNDEIARAYHYAHPIEHSLIIPSIVGSGNSIIMNFQVSENVDLEELRTIAIDTIRKSTYKYVRSVAYGQSVASINYPVNEVAIT